MASPSVGTKWIFTSFTNDVLKGDLSIDLDAADQLYAVLYPDDTPTAAMSTSIAQDNAIKTIGNLNTATGGVAYENASLGTCSISAKTVFAPGNTTIPSASGAGGSLLHNVLLIHETGGTVTTSSRLVGYWTVKADPTGENFINQWSASGVWGWG